MIKAYVIVPEYYPSDKGTFRDGDGDLLDCGQIVFFQAVPRSDGYYDRKCIYYVGGRLKSVITSTKLVAERAYPDENSATFLLPGGQGGYWHAHSLPNANVNIYGSGYEAWGGSHYGLREETALCTYLGGVWQTKVSLPSNYRVIIAQGQGYTRTEDITSTNLNYVRAWGYIKSDGTVIETSGLYLDIRSIYQSASSYAINTK